MNWPNVFPNIHDTLKEKLPLSESQFYEAFERLFGPYEDLDKTVHAKYKNTVDFINSVLKDT